MLTIVVFGGLGLVLLVAACIVVEIVAGFRRRSDGVEKTVGRVTRVRGPVRGQLEGGAMAECLGITVEYYTRHGEGPFQVQRMIPLAAASSYAKNDRVIVSYDIRAPRRARIAGKVSYWPQMFPAQRVPQGTVPQG